MAADKARNACWSARAVEAEKKVNMLQQLFCGGSVVKELRLLKKQASKPSSFNILAKNRSILSSDIDKLQHWAENFSEVSNCCSSSCQLDTEALHDIIAATKSYRELFADDENSSQSISEDEIQVVIAQLRDGKAPGDDGLSAELLRLGGGKAICWLTSLIKFVWINESIPSDWLNHLIVPLHKKGSRSECDNYRSVALLSVPRKVFTHVILNRI